MTSNILWTPSKLLSYGPTKLLLDDFHWYDAKCGIIGSYTPRDRDVKDHFGIFRGVDQIEAFAQASIVSCGVISECAKQSCQPDALKDKFIPAFISIGQVYFHNYLKPGETFISMGQIKFHKFRQMVCDGRIYKVTAGLDLDDYFNQFDKTKFINYELDASFTLVAELFDVTGRAIKTEVFKQ